MDPKTVMNIESWWCVVHDHYLLSFHGVWNELVAEVYAWEISDRLFHILGMYSLGSSIGVVWLWNMDCSEFLELVSWSNASEPDLYAGAAMLSV